MSRPVNTCDCCGGGYKQPTKYGGNCHCWCSNCDKPMSNCKYTCNTKKN